MEPEKTFIGALLAAVVVAVLLLLLAGALWQSEDLILLALAIVAAVVVIVMMVVVYKLGGPWLLAAFCILAGICIFGYMVLDPSAFDFLDALNRGG
jgi:uncharacterized membrane protein YccC